MAWTYEVPTGSFGHNGVLIGRGYSGCGEGLNNVAYEQDKDVGPIPRGQWMIGDFFDDDGGKGPVVAHLTPFAETDTLNRDGFMIHGDNEAMDHTASHGCIILDRAVRDQITASFDRVLVVTGDN
jgi:hypothetical protein